MKLLNTIAASALAGWLAAVSPIYAQEQVKSEPVGQEEHPATLEASVDHLSKYVFRGFTYSEQPVTQATVVANKGNLTGIVFANYDGDMQPDQLNELDASIEYAIPMGEKGTAVLGYTYLHFPNTEIPDSQELYAVLTLDTILNPTLTIAHDVDAFKGTDVELSLHHSFDLGRVGIDVRGTTGWGDYARERRSLRSAGLNLSFPIAATDHVTITPMLAYQTALDTLDFQDELSGGVGMTVKLK